jgi:hypothetical protein
MGDFSVPILGMANDFLQFKEQEKVNRDQQVWQENMYQRQRQDSLFDWARQNEYNSPEQQMNRLRQAGLNPNLVYGKGADNTAVAVRSSNPGSYNPVAPKVPDAAGRLMQAASLRQIQAQTDNVSANAALARKDSLLKDAQISQLGQQTSTSAFELQKNKALMDSAVAHASLENSKLGLEVSQGNQRFEMEKGRFQIDVDRNEREKLSNSAYLSKTVQEVLGMKLKNAMNDLERQQLETAISNAKKEGVLRDLEIQLNDVGIQKHDPIYWRMLFRGLMSIDPYPDHKPFEGVIRRSK